jgi:RND family efflux transporter MFP subunit
MRRSVRRRAGFSGRWLWLCCAALLSCARGRTPEAADAGPLVLGPESVARVTTQELATGPRIAGTLEPRLMARVRAEVTGTIEKLGADLGDHVKAGAVLAVISGPALRQSAASAQAQLQAVQRSADVARLAYQRAQTLNQQGASSKAELEGAQAQAASAQGQVDAARAALAQASTNLSHATARVPFDGVVSARPVNVGDVVQVGAELFTIIDPSSMRLDARVPSEALGAVSPDAGVRFSVRGYPDRRFEGSVEQVGPAADPATREVLVRVNIPNQEGRLLAGLFAVGRVSAKQAQGLTIPFEAVDLEAREHEVAAVREGRVARVKVELGLIDEVAEAVEVKSGLEEGEVVLLGAARTLAAGTPVVISQPAGTALR